LTVSEPYNPESAISLPRPGNIATTGEELNEQQQQVLALFDELRDRLLRYVLSFGLSSADGEEIIQEAFLSLMRHLKLGRSRHNLRGWLFRVVHNQALKRRANERRRDVSSDGALDTALYRDPSPNPEERAAMSQRQSRLLLVLNVLSERDRNCLRLRAEGLRYREIAKVLGISLGSVAASLSCSLERLGRADRR
jgi:RNA polymerase sigma-70 factor, ECF subfamily